MARILCFLFSSLLVCSFCSFSQSNIVQGPFSLDGEVKVYIKSEKDENYPLAIYYESKGKSHKVESYEVEGDEPHVETVFLLSLKARRT